jgi:hypothetical protein
VSSRPPSRLTLALAFVAWLAQLCLPVVHAATMPVGTDGMALWCGAGSPAIEARLADLPREIRQILDPGAAHAELQEYCEQHCASSAGNSGLPPAVAGFVPCATDAEPVIALPFQIPHRAHGAPPPARGPPLSSSLARI